MSSTVTTPTVTNIFPTATSSGATRDSGIGGQNPTTYYFVFLGVLVVLLTIAATLSLRALRIRRRYRTATQLAIMRGEPLPPMHNRDDYWGFGPMGWRNAEGGDEVDRAMAAGMRVRGGKGAWEKVPVLLEAEVDEKGDGEGLESCQPVTLHSLLPRPVPSAASPEPAAPASRSLQPRQPGGASRIDFSEIRRQIRNGPRPAPALAGAPAQVVTELSRGVEIGEDVRVAIVIRMPRDPAEVEQEERRSMIDEDEERPGWESGMELGVWEGVVGGDKR